ncbi:MAG: hypothetical protein ACREPC_00135 [Stenotrophomonas sp.]|uniref:hypothetical protein n=1 Tax=Stenotrophomonas sp. TaxID=69392 RepID=UPI003D6DA429
MSIINTKIHTTVAAALRCKLGNQTLSPTTLKKLTVIANREFGGDATRVFGKASPGIGRFNGDAAGLRNAISSQLLNVRSPQLANVMRQWLTQLPAPNVPSAVVRTPTPIACPVGQQEKQTSVNQWLADAPPEPAPDYDDEAPSVVTSSAPKPKPGREPDLPKPDYPRAVTFSDEIQRFDAISRSELGRDIVGGVPKATPAERLSQFRDEGGSGGKFDLPELMVFAEAAAALSKAAKVEIDHIVATTAAPPTAVQLAALIARIPQRDRGR